jgi:hypothetical protein
MRWITRQNAKVDRIACPWLIRRFVDPAAEFVFAPSGLDPKGVVGATPFDIPGVELGHVDGRCSFESILVKYSLDDPALLLLGQIVHGADIPEDLASSPPEAYGLRAIAHGFAALHGNADHEKIRLETPLYDALYVWCQERVRMGGVPR